ncbi:MAG: hypothetical protein MKZ95_03225 [Pirellulales bacterium]|nr:hypothetical protein [Pirellulales bacterium]
MPFAASLQADPAWSRHGRDGRLEATFVGDGWLLARIFHPFLLRQPHCLWQFGLPWPRYVSTSDTAAIAVGASTYLRHASC